MNRLQHILKKIGRKILRVMLSIVLVLVVFLTITFVIHQIYLHKEEKLIVDYGQKLHVFDGTMNVTIDGHGPDTIVLLTGFGTSSPRLDFTPLINALADNYKIITIEPFGYGLSSETKRERNLENMVEEIHEVTQQLGLNHFILMGHSIAGLYSLKYVNQYPAEVTAFIGIDTSVPNQPWPGYNSAPLDFLAKAGVMRAFLKVFGDSTPIDPADAQRKEQMHMITMQVTGNKTIAREASSLTETFQASKQLQFPKDLPILLFVDKNSAVKNWINLHQEQANSVNHGKLILLEGSHYLHHTQSIQIVKDMEIFLNEKVK